jgi:hypothetical protein
MNITKATPEQVNGTSKQGRFSATFKQMVEAFGHPEEVENDDKITVEWNLKFEDGTIATIYDYYGLLRDPKGGFLWNIGGHTEQAWKNVANTIGKLVSNQPEPDGTEQATYDVGGVLYAYKKIKPAGCSFTLWIRKEG